MKREELINNTNCSDFDVTVIGGGISGARIYSELCSRGYRVLLIDKGDFGCGTSQASGMMIWGGLLYLKNLDFKTVYKLSKARDGMLAKFPDMVDSRSFRYMPCQTGGRNRMFVYWALVLYWLLGSRKRHFPKGEKEYSELKLVNSDQFKKSLTYEEAFLNLSDCRFVLHWLMAWQSERTIPLNYCSVKQSSYKDNHWHLSIKDGLHNKEFECKSKFIVNAAGVWTDTVNSEFEVESIYRHRFSKGVYLNLPKPSEHLKTLIFEMGLHGDSLTYVPWGPVSMWGPTETPVENLTDAFIPDKNDIQFLLDSANKNLRRKFGISDIVSVRTGVRPLAVKKGFNKKVYPLNLSRKHLINKSTSKNFLSIYGGKLTSCGIIADEVAHYLTPHIKKTAENKIEFIQPNNLIHFPKIKEELPSPEWCKKHEACHTLEDYLRRRTNISQWVANEGFGRNMENETLLKSMAETFTPSGKQFQNHLSNVNNSILNTL